MPAHRRSALELRIEFDEAFARAHPPEAADSVDLLVILVGGHRYALPLEQVAALHERRKLTEVPSRRRELLGLVGLRGLVVPVYDLSLLLGYEALSGPRWLAQVKSTTPLGLGFEHFEQHLRVPKAALAPLTREAEDRSRYANGSVPTSGGPATVIDLLAIFQQIRQDGRREESS